MRCLGRAHAAIGDRRGPKLIGWLLYVLVLAGLAAQMRHDDGMLFIGALGYVPAVLLGFGCAIAALFDRARPAHGRPYLSVATACGLLIVASLAGYSAHEARTRRAALDKLAPVVAALHRFETEHGRPAYELKELVPDYLRQPGPSPVSKYEECHYRTQGANWRLRFTSYGWDTLMVTYDSATREYTFSHD